MDKLLDLYQIKGIATKDELFNFIIENPSKLNCYKLIITLSKEKKVDSNPYYSFNQYLNDCINASNKILEIKDNFIDENLKSVLADTRDPDIKYYIENPIYKIIEFYGGHRNKNQKDCLVKIVAIYKNNCVKSEIIRKIKHISKNYDIDCIVE